LCIVLAAALLASGCRGCEDRENWSRTGPFEKEDLA